jgi:preprotein translocase subunit SecB
MEAISKFKFSNCKVERSTIEFKDIDRASSKLSIDIGVAGKDDRKNNRFSLKMDVKVRDEEENMNINVVMIGFFEFDHDCTEKELGMYFNTNAPAIIFPYVRAYIASLTTLSGVAPVVLPTLNVVRLAKELEENTTTE